jgi:4-amino-4-deoxy-L-arabinose transferase-like glycosyltransferase
MTPAMRAAAILVAAVVLLFSALGRADLFNPDEPREAEIAREMWESGDLLVPRLNGEPFLEKPPLFHWLVASAYRLAGGPSEFAARLVPAIAGVLSVLLTYLFGRGIVGERGAALAAIVLLTAFEFWWLSRRCLIDTPMALMVLLACGALHRGAVNGGRGRAAWLLAGYLAAGAAVLFKGIIGAGMPALALAGYLLARRDWRGFFRHGLLPGALLATLPALAWGGLLYGRLGAGAAREFFWVNNVLRFTGGATGKGHTQPFHYYLPTFLLDFAPWSLLVPFAAASAFLFLRRSGAARGGAGGRDSVLYLLCWFAVPFVVLSIASTKRGIYLVPIYPAAALLIGWWMARFDRGAEAARGMTAAEGRIPERGAASARLGAALLRPAGIPLALLLAGAIVLSAALLFSLLTVRPLDWIAPSACLALLLPTGVVAYRALRARHPCRAAFLCAAIAGIAYLGLATLVIAEVVNGGASAREAGSSLRRLIVQGDRVAFYQARQGTIGGILFYAGLTLPNLRSPGELERHLSAAAGAPGTPRSMALIREDIYRDVAPRLGVPTTIARRFDRRLTFFDAPRRGILLVVAGEIDDNAPGHGPRRPPP